MSIISISAGSPARATRSISLARVSSNWRRFARPVPVRQRAAGLLQHLHREREPQRRRLGRSSRVVGLGAHENEGRMEESEGVAAPV
jgi:hypothetical protein